MPGRAYFKWKEQLVFEMDGKFLVFEAPMGVLPVNVYVPTVQTWEKEVPDWAKKKRDIVLAVIRKIPELGSIIEVDDAWIRTKPE